MVLWSGSHVKRAAVTIAPAWHVETSHMVCNAASDPMHVVTSAVLSSSQAGDEVIFKNMVVYKTQGFGIFCHGCLNVTIANAMVADNQYGVEFSRVGNNTLKDSIIIALSDNLGNPVDCK